MSRELLYLTAADVDRAGACMELALECVEEVLSLHESGGVDLPSKVVLDMDERSHGRINAMPAHVGGSFNMCGIKWIAGFPNNPRRYGLPRANAIIVLNSPETGLPLCIMDGTRISALRTGAVTGVGAKYLSLPDARTVGLIGAGVQARTQIEALLRCRPGLSHVSVFDLNADTAESFRAFCRERWPHVHCEIVPGAEPAVVGADVVVTATVADEPIVRDRWLKPGVLFTHVGSYQEEEEEVILNVDKVVVDIWEEVLHRGTPLLARMFQQGRIGPDRIYANLGEIVLGRKPGRVADTERIFFSPLGLGSEDIALATRVYRKAINEGIGVKLPV